MLKDRGLGKAAEEKDQPVSGTDISLFLAGRRDGLIDER